jgi:hypothetical protein
MYSMKILPERLAAALLLDRAKRPLRDVLARVRHRDDAGPEIVSEVVVRSLHARQYHPAALRITMTSADFTCSSYNLQVVVKRLRRD